MLLKSYEIVGGIIAIIIGIIVGVLLTINYINVV